jgi:RNA polymerase sigma-70 factor (ECF subfamily)
MKDQMEDIIRGCCARERWAQERLYKQFSGLLYAICLRYAKNKMDAQDVLQEVFVKIYNHIHTYHFDGSFEGWLRRIAVNTSITFYRKAIKKHVEKDIDEGVFEVANANEDWSQEFSMEEMTKCIQQLPHGYKTIFNLYVIEGYKHKEIADMLSIDINTSKSQLSRAKVHIQNELHKMNKIMSV